MLRYILPLLLCLRFVIVFTKLGQSFMSINGLMYRNFCWLSSLCFTHFPMDSLGFLCHFFASDDDGGEFRDDVKLNFHLDMSNKVLHHVNDAFS
jgi:hypothetical protein